MKYVKAFELLEQQQDELARAAEAARRAKLPENLAAERAARKLLVEGHALLARANPAPETRAMLDELEQLASAALDARDGRAACDHAQKFQARSARESLLSPAPDGAGTRTPPAVVESPRSVAAPASMEETAAGGPDDDELVGDRVEVDETQLTLTIFPDQWAMSAKRRTATWAELVEWLHGAKEHKTKATCPWLKLATFGEKLTAKGCVRSNDNMLEVFGLEGDFDSGEVSPTEAAERLRNAGVRAVVYTSGSHLQPGKGNRWRVLAPLSKPCSPAERARLMDLLNGALGGILTLESWTASQAYYFGRVEGVAYECIEVKGDPIDELDCMIAPIGKPGRPVAEHVKREAREPEALDQLTGEQVSDLREALAVIPSDERDTWVRLGHALKRCGDAGRELWFEWSQKSDKFDEADAERVWASAHGDNTSYAAIFAEAQRLGWENPRCVSAPTGDDFNDLDAGKSKGAAIKSLHLTTNQANAGRLAKHHGADLAHMGGNWHGFNGKQWARSDAQATRFGMRLSRIIAGEVVELSEKARRADGQAERERLHKMAETLAKFGARAENAAEIASALRLAAAQLQRDPAEFDADPWLFNCLNGTLELRTGRLREHRREDHITRLAPTAYVPGASRARFELFLGQVCPDPQTVAFLKRFLGYCLTGMTSEQVMLILWGEGSNGKSTLVKILRAVLGPYVQMAPPKLLEDSRSDRHPTEIADLMGSRLVFASETEEGARLREAFVKSITGSEPLKARVMYSDFFEFVPSHKLILSTNHKPLIVGTDYAIWRRLMLVLFEVKFGSPEEVATGKCAAVKDQTLEAALLAEREGVLAWLVEGCLEWQRDGLRPPASVRAATAAYRVDLDKLGAFLEERCTIDPAARTSAGTLYASYANWCALSGYQAEGQRVFGLRMTERALTREHRRDGWYWLGVALRPEDMSA